MNNNESSQDKELLEMIKRFESMKNEGKIIYLDPEQYEDIAEHYIETENREDAYDAVRMGLEIHQNNTLLLAILVALYMDDGYADKAREIVDRIIYLDDCPFYVKLAQVDLLIVDGKEDEARQIIESFSLQTDIDEVDYIEIASLCHEIGFLDKAEEWFSKYLAIDPENDEAILGFCENAQAMGQYEDTIKWYNKLLDKDPYNATLWTGLAKSYFHIGNMGKAIEATDFALVSNTKSSETYIYKAHALYQQGNYQEAIKAYEDAWRTDEQETEYAYLFISFCYIGMEQWDNAYKYSQKALLHIKKDSPLLQDAMLNSARCLYSLKRFDETHDTLAQIKEHYPHYIAAYLYDARCYLEQGNKQMAISVFDEAINISPEADTWYQIGVIALDCDEPELAADAFHQVSDLDPNYESTEKENLELAGEKYSWADIMKMKEFLNKAAEISGEKLQEVDIEENIRKAIEEGKSPEVIEQYRSALELLNKIIRDSDKDADRKAGNSNYN